MDRATFSVALPDKKLFHKYMEQACEATEEVLQGIPHRPPFLFVDRVLRLTDAEIVAERTLRAEEFFFKGHYPQQALMPGVLMCEAVFQTAGIWMSRTILKSDWMRHHMPVLIRIESAKFKQMAFPGDCLQLVARFVQRMKDFYWFKGQVKQQDRVLVALEFVLGVVPRSDA